MPPHLTLIGNAGVADGQCKIDELHLLKDDASRKAKCDTIGGTVQPITCKMMVSFGCVLLHDVHLSVGSTST